jgi:hypothetical protein
LLVCVGFSCRDDPNDTALGAIAVNYHKESQALAQTEENESIFLFRVVRVIYQECAFVGEDRLSIFKRDFMLPKIDQCLLRIPLELDGRHVPIVRMAYVHSNGVTAVAGCAA